MIHRRYFLAVALLTVLAFILSGCGSVRQVEPAALTAAKDMILESPYRMDVELSFVNNNLIFAYSCFIDFQGETSRWDGTARVLYKLTAFEQKCKSETTADGSWKQWRSGYAVSDTKSPSKEIARWLQMAAAGQGREIGTPVPASDLSDAFPQECGKVHLLVLEGVVVDWNALCDTHIDSIFGGQDLLDSAGACTVTLLFREKTHDLVGAYLSAMEGATALEAALVLTSTGNGPEIESSVFDGAVQDAPLSEEWEIISR